MAGPLWLSVFAFLTLYLALLALRARLERLRRELDRGLSGSRRTCHEDDSFSLCSSWYGHRRSCCRPAASAGRAVSFRSISCRRPSRFPRRRSVIAAYAVVWLVVFFYVFSVWRRLDRVERELKEVIGRVAAGGRP